jgi:hypothetical protein
MNNAQNNESQDKQTQRAADSPLKKPETETAKAKPSDVAAAAQGREAGLGQAGGSTPDSSLEHTGPLGKTNVTHQATPRATKPCSSTTPTHLSAWMLRW